MITRVAEIETPAIWVTLRREYDRNNEVPPSRKTTRQHARWFKLRNILRARDGKRLSSPSVTSA
jgi:hypothetical protein